MINKLVLTSAQKEAIEAFFKNIPKQRLIICSEGFWHGWEGVHISDSCAIKLLKTNGFDFADLMEEKNIPLSQEQKREVSVFLINKTGRMILSCDSGFLYVPQEVRFDEPTAIRWVEQHGSLAELFK
jgi:hypothetical protein